MGISQFCRKRRIDRIPVIEPRTSRGLTQTTWYYRLPTPRSHDYARPRRFPTMSSYGGMRTRVKKVQVQPVMVIFKHMEKADRVQIWLKDDSSMRIEGIIKGFDEYMNIVLNDAAEVNIKTKQSKSYGQIMLKGDTIALIQSAC